MTKTVTSKKRTRQLIDQNPVEAVRDLPLKVAGSLVSDLGKPALTKDLFEQLLGLRSSSKTKNVLEGDLSEGEVVDIKALEQKISKVEQGIERIAPAIDYHREVIKGSEIIAKENTFVLQRRIEEIIIELRKLAKSSKELEVTFREVTVEAIPVNPGKYHLNFLEWMVSIIKSARLRVEESKTWLSLFASKKAKRSYWAMFKKYGTTFGLSHERIVATQTG